MPTANRVTWHDDTLREMATWAARRYGLGVVHICWASKIEKPNHEPCFGRMLCLDRKPPFYIELLESRTHVFLIQVLAHELTHCIALKRYHYSGHKKKFVEIGNELISAWNRRNGEIAGKRKC
jgi:hypothetical protein